MLTKTKNSQNNKPPLSTYSSTFNKALQLAQQGNVTQSLKIFTNLTKISQNDYCTLINYGVLNMQQGKIQQARNTFKIAIQNDCYQYMAYYNMFVLQNCQLQAIYKQYLRHGLTKQNLQQKVPQSDKINNKRKQILKYLYITLSCLYADISQSQNDPKLCTKSLYYGQQNSRAYANRAYLYSKDNKNKLAQNDYSSAIYYDQYNPIFYMKRAQYYWKNNKITQSNTDLKQYWQLKNNKQKYKFTKLLANQQDLQQIKQLKCKEIEEGQLDNFQNIFTEKSMELMQLLERIRKFKQNWVFRVPSNPRNFQNNVVNDGNIPKLEIEFNRSYQLQDQSKQKQQQKQQQKVQNQQQNLLDMDKFGEISADQSSKNISQQIQKLQKQIRLYGKSCSIKQTSANQQLLSAQIQKTIKQIQKIKIPQQPKPNQNQNQNLNQNAHKSDSTKNTQKYIDTAKLQKYKKILLQILSAQFFDPTNKQQCKINTYYGKQKYQTQYSKNNFWKQKFILEIQHSLHKSYKSGLEFFGELEQDFSNNTHEGQILIQLEMKSKSIWSSKKIVGKGYISIHNLSQIKCVLSDQKQKTGIVYFKIKLQ